MGNTYTNSPQIFEQQYYTQRNISQLCIHLMTWLLKMLIVLSIYHWCIYLFPMSYFNFLFIKTNS